MRSFGATNEPGTCPWCGRKLIKTRMEYKRDEDGKRHMIGRMPAFNPYAPFDTIGCAMLFAIRAHETGVRFEKEEA